MRMYRKCPRCGSPHVQLSLEQSKHGCFWFILFGIGFVLWRIVKYCIGIVIFLCFDWYMAIIASARNKGYVWHCKKWFSGKRQLYYCHNCGYNFRA